jgi:hypothetical protein
MWKERKSEENLIIFAYVYGGFFSLFCYCYHCDGFVYPAGQFQQKFVLYIAYLYDQLFLINVHLLYFVNIFVS